MAQLKSLKSRLNTRQWNRRKQRIQFRKLNYTIPQEKDRMTSFLGLAEAMAKWLGI